MPKFSVIIPVYNCADFVGDALKSVIEQSNKDYEIIVVDDGSTDNLKERLEPFADKIRYIYQENKGHSCARNTGIKNAKGEFIAFLDADDMWLPDKLEVQIVAFRANPKIGFIHGDICKFMDKDKEKLIPSLRKNFSDELIRRHSGNIFDAFLCREIFISCPTVVVKKECFDKVGLFDENLSRLGFEDSEMWLRILKYYGAYYIHKPLALYRIRPNSMSKNRKKMAKAHRYVITKLSNQYNLPPTLRKKAINAMLKEWGLRQYVFSKYARRIVRFIRSKLMGKMIKRRVRLIISTLFDISGAFSLLVFLNKLFRKNRVVILMYHRVFDLEKEDGFPFYLVGPSTKRFEKQVEYLSKKYNLMTLNEFAYLYQEKKSIPPNSVIITIDDGYIDCYRNIFPILKKYNAPATIFLSTGYVNSRSLFWVDELAYCIKNTKLREFSLDGLGGKFKLENKKDRQQAIDSVVKIFRRLKEENRKQMMDSLIKALSNGEKIYADLNLTWEQVREMSKQRISFGAHTISHPILTRISEEEAKREILESKRRIEEEIKKPALIFCYPSGENDTFNEFHKEILRENGFLCAVSTVSGVVSENSDLFALRRISVDRADTMALFKAKLTGIFEAKNSLKKRIVQNLS